MEEGGGNIVGLTLLLPHGGWGCIWDVAAWGMLAHEETDLVFAPVSLL